MQRTAALPRIVGMRFNAGPKNNQRTALGELSRGGEAGGLPSSRLQEKVKAVCERATLKDFLANAVSRRAAHPAGPRRDRFCELISVNLFAEDLNACRPAEI